MIIISFVGHFPIQKIRKIAKRNVIRAIADPWFNFSAFIKDGIQTPSSLDFIFEGITKNKPIYFTKDAEIDLFTIYFCYLFVVLLLNKQKIPISTDDHLGYISSVLNVSKDDLLMYVPGGDPEELLTLLATKGGITEMIHSLFVENPNILPIDIIAEVSRKFV